MQQKATPQEMFDVFKQAISQLAPEGQQVYAHVPDRWEELSKEQQERFRVMSLKMNAIVGEFRVE